MSGKTLAIGLGSVLMIGLIFAGMFYLIKSAIESFQFTPNKSPYYGYRSSPDYMCTFLPYTTVKPKCLTPECNSRFLPRIIPQDATGLRGMKCLRDSECRGGLSCNYFPLGPGLPVTSGRCM